LSKIRGPTEEPSQYTRKPKASKNTPNGETRAMSTTEKRDDAAISHHTKAGVKRGRLDKEKKRKEKRGQGGKKPVWGDGRGVRGVVRRVRV